VRLVSPACWAGATALALLLGIVAFATEIATSGRTRRPDDVRAATLAAYESASRSPGARWAADELRVASGALRAALLVCSRQENRLFVLRDFRPAVEALRRGEAASREAERLGALRRDEARANAMEVVRQARELEKHALALVAVTSLPGAQRTQLLRARLLVQEAETLLDDGDVVAAEERALRSEAELGRAVGPALEAAQRFTSRAQVATWRRWIEESRRHSRSTGEPAILVLKEKNLLILLSRGVPVSRYDAEVGANALGIKRQKGDRATPEGRYRIVKKKDLGQSIYHRALLLDYPNAADRERFAAAQRRGEIPRGSAIGGLIEIHGDGGRGQNWTDGCVALDNRDMDDLFRRVGIGTRVTIVGGDGSDGAFSSLLARVNQPGEGS